MSTVFRYLCRHKTSLYPPTACKQVVSKSMPAIKIVFYSSVLLIISDKLFKAQYTVKNTTHTHTEFPSSCIFESVLFPSVLSHTETSFFTFFSKRFHFIYILQVPISALRLDLFFLQTCPHFPHWRRTGVCFKAFKVIFKRTLRKKKQSKTPSPKNQAIPLFFFPSHQVI